MPSVEFTEFQARMAAAPPPPPPGSLTELRDRIEASMGNLPLADGTAAEEVDADGVHAILCTRDGGEDDPWLVYFHGGGYRICSARAYRAHGSQLAAACHARVLLVDYRLAPEHPFPAGIEDVVAAYRGLLAEGLDPSRIVIAGDSAGGGLTMATLISLRDAGVPLPAAGVCLSPWVDLTLTSASITERAALDPWIGKAGLALMVQCYLGDGDPQRPLASPILADLHGLPPLLILVGTAEVLHDDAATLAARAQAAGVAVTFEAWEEMIHVWPMFPNLPEAHEAVAKVGRFVRERTA